MNANRKFALSICKWAVLLVVLFCITFAGSCGGGGGGRGSGSGSVIEIVLPGDPYKNICSNPNGCGNNIIDNAANSMMEGGSVDNAVDQAAMSAQEAAEAAAKAAADAARAANEAVQQDINNAVQNTSNNPSAGDCMLFPDMAGCN